MRESFNASLGSTNSFGGFEVLAGSGLTVETGGSGVGSFALGFERVARAIVRIGAQLDISNSVVEVYGPVKLVIVVWRCSK